MANINQNNLSEETQKMLSEPVGTSDVPIHVQLYRKLQRAITEGYLKEGDMLPTEMELSKLMGAGRTSLRSALILLYEDGYVRTYRGRGTFVTWKKENRKDYPDGYMLPEERVRAELGGCEVQASEYRSNSFDAFLAEVLGTGREPLKLLIRKYGLGKNEAALSSIYFPAGLIGEDENPAEKLGEIYREKVSKVKCSLRPVSSGSIKSYEIRIPGEQFLLQSSLWIDAEGNPVAYCKDYYNCDAVQFKVSYDIG